MKVTDNNIVIGLLDSVSIVVKYRSVMFYIIGHGENEIDFFQNLEISVPKNKNFGLSDICTKRHLNE